MKVFLKCATETKPGISCVSKWLLYLIFRFEQLQQHKYCKLFFVSLPVFNLSPALGPVLAGMLLGSVLLGSFILEMSGESLGVEKALPLQALKEDLKIFIVKRINPRS